MFICLFLPNIAMASGKNPILVDQGSSTEVSGLRCLVLKKSINFGVFKDHEADIYRI